MSDDTTTEAFEEATETEPMYQFFPFIKIEHDGSILVDGQPGDQDIISQMNIESAKVLVLPYTKMVDQLETLNGSQGEYQELIEEITEGVVEDPILTNSESDISETTNHDHNYEEVALKKTDNGCYSYLTAKNSCDLCQRSFNTPATLKRHMRTHTGERPFQCQICEKFFSQQSNLWKHVRTHTGERPFECPHCNKKFSQRANMKKHLVIHTGERPFVCYYCYRAFTQQANLSKHMRLHTGEKPYCCSYCDKRFTQRSNLQKHEHLHEGIKPYTCEVCFQAFTQQSNLKKHEMMHNNVRKYVCDICSKSYVQKVSLVKHRQRCALERQVDMDADEDSKYSSQILHTEADGDGDGDGDADEEYIENPDELIKRYEALEEECMDNEENSQSFYDQQINNNTQLVLSSPDPQLFDSQIIEIQINNGQDLSQHEIIQLITADGDHQVTELQVLPEEDE